MNTQLFAKKVRINVLKVLTKVGYGHYGGSLSLVECLSVLYNGGLNIDVNDLKNPNRDYVVLSKGHAGPALYSSLFVKGIIDEELLFSLNQGGTNLPSHPDKNKTPGIDMTTGSLGQGVAVATGIAIKNKVENRKNYTIAIVGDGELNEGQCWEAFQFAASQKLKNFIVFIDYNKRQIDGYVWDICDLRNIAEKMTSFGFEAQDVKGNDVEAIKTALDNAKNSDYEGPKAIVLDTIKGQGVPFIEEIMDNHHIRPTSELNDQVLRFISSEEEDLKGCVE